MDRKRSLILIGAVVAVAGGTGFVMQSMAPNRPDRGATLQSQIVPLGLVSPEVQPQLDAAAVGGRGAGGVAATAIAPPVTLAAFSADDVVSAVPDAPVPDAPEAAEGGAPPPALVDDARALPRALPEAPEAETGPVAPATPPLAPPATPPATPPVALVDDAPVPDAPVPHAPVPDVAADPCAMSLTTAPLPGAMVEVALIAPCHVEQRVVLRQGPLAVTGRTSVAGLLVTTLPAFENPAVVSVIFGDGTRATDVTEVPDLARFDRIAVQWMAQDAFQIHAYADGATFGGPGHTFAKAPGAAGATGGFVTALGTEGVDRPLRAEVYTYPTDRTADIRIDLEATLTPLTCGREIMGETVQRRAGVVEVLDLTVAMPDCDGSDGYLVLQDIGADVTLAAR